MKRNEPQSVGEILRLAIEHYSLGSRLAECRAVECWPIVVGRRIAGECGRPSVANGMMTISVASASLRQELSMSRSKLISLLNKAVGSDAVKELRFIS